MNPNVPRRRMSVEEVDKMLVATARAQIERAGGKADVVLEEVLRQLRMRQIGQVRRLRLVDEIEKGDY